MGQRIKIKEDLLDLAEEVDYKIDGLDREIKRVSKPKPIQRNKIIENKKRIVRGE
jgi:hypothetical protein